MTAAFKNDIEYSKQLFKEFEDICYFHDVSMETPNINISDAKTHFGSWDPTSRTLSISRYLIKTYPWHVVIEVLKHEMAHQYVTDILKTRSGHGPLFQQACQKLGVHPQFARSGGNISSDMMCLHKALSPDAEKMTKKVEKLLSLATSDNEHEAQLASKKANDLIQKHNLNRLKRNNFRKNDQVTYIVITHKKKRIESIQKSLLAILRDFYFVNTVTTNLYDAQDQLAYRSMVLFGTPENLQVAEYVYHYLFRSVKSLWNENRIKFGYTRKDKVSFDMGFTRGIRARLEQTQLKDAVADTGTKTMAITSSTLVSIMKQKNKTEVKRVFPKLKKSTYGSHFKGSAYKNGYKNGKSTLIKKAIHKKDSGTTPLLS